MMRRLRNLARRDRIHRFLEVWGTEGRRAAIRAAARHIMLGLKGHVPTGVTASAPGDLRSATGCAMTAIWTELAQKDAFHVTASPAVQRRRRSVAMIGDLNLPQCRKYRVEQLDEIWGAADVGYDFAHYQDVPRCLNILQSATHLMLYRLGASALTEMYLYEARRLKLPVLYDIDDPLFSFPAYETYSNGDALDPGMRRALIDQAPSYFAVMQQADALTLSTPGLLEAAARMSTRPAYLRRNFADRATLEAGRRHKRSGPTGGDFTVAFASGSLGHEVDLLSIKEPLERFITAAPSRRLQILGRFDLSCLPPKLRARTVIKPFTTYPAYLAALAHADCAMLPLVDDAFNRCKSAVRVIDAASVGVPSIVGETGDGTAMVETGATGVVAGKDGWFDALERLAHDPGNTHAMGVRARGDLERRWAASTTLPVLEPSLIDDVIA